MMERIIRIVRMTFHPERIPEFLALFDARSKDIRNFQGCERLELVASVDSPTVYLTVSIWTSEADLEAYRSSDFFRDTWSSTRRMFSAPPEAESFSLTREDPA